jgi:hypothetical protein
LHITFEAKSGLERLAIEAGFVRADGANLNGFMQALGESAFLDFEENPIESDEDLVPSEQVIHRFSLRDKFP